MKVQAHCNMLSKQFLLATQRPHHPNRVDLTAPPPPRQMKKTLTSRFGAEIRQLSQPDLPEAVYKRKLKAIHTSSVRNAISQMQPNKVLNAAPPPINDAEKRLPRSSRATLSQLRSGYSKFLNSYKARINSDFQDICPLCNNDQHTTQHLFNCPANRTDLTTNDLWSRPTEAARFLNLNLATDDFDEYG